MQALQQLGEPRVVDSESEAAAMAGGSVYIATAMDPVDAALIECFPEGLGLVSNLGVGTDNIDFEALARRGIAVSNTPVVTEDTADLTMALMLAACPSSGAPRGGQASPQKAVVAFLSALDDQEWQRLVELAELWDVSEPEPERAERAYQQLIRFERDNPEIVLKASRAPSSNCWPSSGSSVTTPATDPSSSITSIICCPSSMKRSNRAAPFSGS